MKYRRSGSFPSVLLIPVVLLGAATVFAQIDPDAEYETLKILDGFDVRFPRDIPPENKEAIAVARKQQQTANKKRTDARAIILAVLTGQESLSARDAQFVIWFEQVVFAEMTQTDPETLLNLPKLRTNFFQVYFENPKQNMPDEVHDRLVKITRAKMLEIAKGSFHPAARYNAVLILGKLNTKEAGSIGSESAAPVAHLQALGDLLTLYRTTDQEVIRVAALLGIRRHAELDGQRPVDQRMSFDARNAIIGELLTLLAAKDPPAGRTLAGHRWLQRRAIDILGAFRDLGPDNVVVKTLAATIDDKDLPFSQRCTAALALSRLNYPAPGNPGAADPSAAARQLAQLASAACRQELTRLQEEQTRYSGKASKGSDDRGGGPGPAMGGDVAGFDPAGFGAGADIIPAGPAGGSTAKSAGLAQYRLDSSRRLLKYYIDSIQEAVGKDDRSGFRRFSVADPHKTFVAKVDKALDEVMDATDNKAKPTENVKELTAEVLVNRVEFYLNKLDELVRVDAPKAPAESPAGAELPEATPEGEIPGGPDPDPAAAAAGPAAAADGEPAASDLPGGSAP